MLNEHIFKWGCRYFSHINKFFSLNLHMPVAELYAQGRKRKKPKSNELKSKVGDMDFLIFFVVVVV